MTEKRENKKGNGEHIGQEPALRDEPDPTPKTDALMALRDLQGPSMAPDDQRDVAVDEVAEEIRRNIGDGSLPHALVNHFPLHVREVDGIHYVHCSCGHIPKYAVGQKVDEKAAKEAHVRHALTALMIEPDRVRVAVENLEVAGLLKLPEVALYDVWVDDPDLMKGYFFAAIEAPTARAAAMEAARRAVREDPGHGMGPGHFDLGPGKSSVVFDEVTAENTGLIDSVAMYSIVRLHGGEDELYVGEGEVTFRLNKEAQAKAAASLEKIQADREERGTDDGKVLKRAQDA